MRIYKKKGKHMVIDGMITYSISPTGVCQCQALEPDPAKKKRFCKHVLELLQQKNESYDEIMLRYLQIPQLKDKLFQNFSKYISEDLNPLITSFLKEHDCLICHESLLSINQHYQCRMCGIMFHTKCRQKWRHKECPYCKSWDESIVAYLTL